MLSKAVLALTISLIFLSGFTSNAHQVKNSITNTTTFIYNQDKTLTVNWDISMPTSEGDLVYNFIDTNMDRIVSEGERKDFINKVQNVFYFNTQNQDYRIQNIEIITTYQELSRYVFPTLQTKLDFGKVDISKEANDITIINKLKFNSLLPQDWNLGFNNQESVVLEDVGYYPEKNTISEEIRAKIRSELGNSNPSFFKRIVNNEYYSKLKTFLKDPNLTVNGILSALFICLVFGMVHSFQPGHGKAIVGSYLAAINGTFKDSVIMALSTTISHTFVVVILGLLWAILKDGINLVLPFINININIPKEWINIIQLGIYIRYIGNIALIFIGIWIGLKYYKQYVDYKLKSKYGVYNELILDTDSDKPFTVLDHGDHKHILPNRRLSLKQSIFLGFNAGLNPCLDSLILFSLAISLGLGWLGFWMIVVFSLGLGISLALVGYITSKSLNKLTTSFSSLERFSVILPIYSSVAIIVLAIINLFS
jgi:nickel/cobalt transporter (NicO) family protein